MQREYFDESECRWSNPKTLILAGPSSSGKSTACFEMIRNRDRLFKNENRMRVQYHLPVGASIHVPEFIKSDELVTFHEGVPDFESVPEETMIILDDMMNLIDQSIVQAYTRFSHHRRLIIVMMVHNVFPPESKLFRTITLNVNIMVVFKITRDMNQLKTLVRQVDPVKWKTIFQAYQHAVSRPYGYFVIDFSPATNDRLRFRANSFESDPELREIIYQV